MQVQYADERFSPSVPYYYHHVLAITQWERPLPEHGPIHLPPGWEEVICVSSGRKYFADCQFQVSQWEVPAKYHFDDWQRFVDCEGLAYWCSLKHHHSFYESDDCWERIEDQWGRIYWSHAASDTRFFETVPYVFTSSSVSNLGAGGSIVRTAQNTNVQINDRYHHHRSDDRFRGRNRVLYVDYWPPRFSFIGLPIGERVGRLIDSFRLGRHIGAMIEWDQLSQVVSFYEGQNAEGFKPSERGIIIKAMKMADVRVASQFAKVFDLEAANVDGISHTWPRQYELHNVTGIDTNVQAVVANQLATVRTMLRVVAYIEEHNPQSIIFGCRGATHRSVGCCIILSQMYPCSTIRLTTRRTQDAARLAGMRRCD